LSDVLTVYKLNEITCRTFSYYKCRDGPVGRFDILNVARMDLSDICSIQVERFQPVGHLDVLIIKRDNLSDVLYIF
jgi:hypothetical protein